MRPKVIIMSGYGINCESESAHAFQLAGGDVDIVHINDLISGKKSLDEFDIMMFPGGFSYGDDTGSGNAYANKIKNNLWEDLVKFIEDKKLILGVCNGFQIMTNLGLFAIDEEDYGKRIHVMDTNDHHRYECRWVNIKENGSGCIFTKGIKTTNLPIAHGEGKFFADEDTIRKLKSNNQIVFTYCDEKGNPANNEFPVNPNGALYDIAGICDCSGRIFGMMPHPERALYSHNAPDFQLKKDAASRGNKKIPETVESNFLIFNNAIEYIKKKGDD